MLMRDCTLVVNLTVKPTNIDPQNVVLGSVLACYLVLFARPTPHSSILPSGDRCFY
eukprot:Pgem_evm1s3362